MEDHVSSSGIARFPTGGNEPILTPGGDRIVDALGRESRVTSAGMGPSVGEYLLMAWLPAGLAQVGERLQGKREASWGTLDEAERAPKAPFSHAPESASFFSHRWPSHYPWDTGWRRSLLRRHPVKELLANGEMRDDRPFAVQDLNS